MHLRMFRFSFISKWFIYRSKNAVTSKMKVFHIISELNNNFIDIFS